MKKEFTCGTCNKTMEKIMENHKEVLDKALELLKDVQKYMAPNTPVEDEILRDVDMFLEEMNEVR